MTTEEQKQFEAFKAFQEQQNNKPIQPKSTNIGDYLTTVWNKYWKYLAIVGLATYACFKILFPWLNELLPDKHLFDEGSYTQIIFSFIANMCAFAFSIFMCWIGFKVNDVFMGKEADSEDGFAYMFDNLDATEDGKPFQLNQGKLWKIIISLFIFFYFYYMFLYGVGLPK